MCSNVCIIYELSSARQMRDVCLACEDIRFSSFFAAGDVSRGGNARNVPIDEERGETDVFAG